MREFTSISGPRTPLIFGSMEEGRIEIKGRCCPEDCADFFQPFINWMKFFHLTESKTIVVSINLEYINTSSSLVLSRILRDLKSLGDRKEVSVLWFYPEDDHDMHEVGKDLQYILGDVIQLQAAKRKAS